MNNNNKILELKNSKAVIFDLDGLLVDSEPLWQIAEINVFWNLGIELTPDDCKQFQGIRIEEVVPMLRKRFEWNKYSDNEVVEMITQEMLRLLENVEIMPGVEDTINYYYENKIPIAIASSSKMILINKAIERLNIKDKISVVHSAEFEKAGKPEPDIFLSTAIMLKTEPKECLVFEDSVYGMYAGIRAGMKVIAVPLHENFENMEYEKADLKIKSLKEWSDIIKS